MKFKLNHHYIIYISIFANCMSYTLCSSSGEFIRRDTSEINSEFQISGEEILRRRKLVEPHILKITEEQKDWIETYHLSYSSSKIPSTKKVLPEDTTSKEYPINNILSKDEIEGSSEKEAQKVQNQRHQFDINEQEILLDNVADSPFIASKSAPQSSEEPSHIHKIVEGFVPELDNLEKGIEINHLHSKDINPEISSHDFDEVKNIVSNNKFKINTKKSISEPKTVDSSSLEYTKIKEYGTEHHHSAVSSGEQDTYVDVEVLDTVSRENYIITKEFQKENVDAELLKYANTEKYIETSYLNSEIKKLNILPNNFKDSLLMESIKTEKDETGSHLTSVHIGRHEISQSNRKELTDSLPEAESLMKTENIYLPNIVDTLPDVIDTKEDTETHLNTEDGKLENFQSDVEEHKDIVSDKFVINSEGIFSNHKMVDAPSSELSKPDLDQIENYYLTVDNVNSLHTIKELTNLKGKEVDRHKIEDSMLCEVTPKEKYEESSSSIECREENNVLDKVEKNDDIMLKKKLPLVAEKLKRRKLVKSFVSSLNQGKENWKETYHLSYEETDSGEVWKSLYSDVNRDKSRYDTDNRDQEVENIVAKVLKPVQIQERLYFNRWLKKLLNKCVNYPFTESISISFSITTNALNDLKKLSASRKFDISTLDDLISDLISNATVHYGYNLSNFSDMFTHVGFYTVVSIILLVLMYYILIYYPISRIIFFFLICILWHAFNMYEQKVAEKHATLSGISPAYCDSILTKESGIYAHIKEYFRYNTHNDHCKKYFEALMIDPISELSLPIIIADLLSSIFFQVFKTMGRALNAFVKDLFFDLSYTQTLYLIVLMVSFLIFCIICTLIYNKYKLKFPFFMGSLEPSATPVGSRVEDLALEANAKKESPVKRIVSNKCDISVPHDTKDWTISLVLHKNDCQNKKSMLLIRRSSF